MDYINKALVISTAQGVPKRSLKRSTSQVIQK